jgi:hypothetical protein
MQETKIEIKLSDSLYIKLLKRAVKQEISIEKYIQQVLARNQIDEENK